MSAPSTSSTSSSIITESTEFPPVQGSFILQSKDDVYFHVAPYVLQHASGFFRNMLALPEASNGAARSQGLSVNVDSSTLRNLLCLIDVTKPNPALDASTIGPLIEAARFYRIPSIITWFESAVFQTKPDEFGGPGTSFIKRHPLVVLSIGHKLGLRNCFQAAMHELVTCDNGRLLDDVNIDFHLYRYMLSIRQTRIDRYRNLIGDLVWNPEDECGDYPAKGQATCPQCTQLRGRWLINMTSTAFNRPEWKVLEPILYGFPTCAKGGGCPSDIWVAQMKEVIEYNIHRMGGLVNIVLPDNPAWLQDELTTNSLTNPQNNTR